MEGKHWRWSSQPRPRDLLRKVREFTRAINEHLSNERSPEIIIDRFRNYCTNPDSNCYCSFDSPKWQEILTLRRASHVRRLDQSVVDRAINDICILLQCGRHNLNVVSVGKRLVMGWLRFSEAGNVFDCINRPNTQMAYDAKFLRVPKVLWHGAFPSDSEKYSLPQQCLLPLTAEGERYGSSHWHSFVCNLPEVPYVHVRRGKRRQCYFDATYKEKHHNGGVYKINIDAEGGTVKISRKVNPSTLLMVLEGSGKHAQVKSVTFDGQVKDDWGGGYNYFGAGYGYNPYGVAPPHLITIRRMEGMTTTGMIPVLS